VGLGLPVLCNRCSVGTLREKCVFRYYVYPVSAVRGLSQTPTGALALDPSPKSPVPILPPNPGYVTVRYCTGPASKAVVVLK